METLRETLVRLLENGYDKVDSSWVDEMSRQYPYFTVPALLQVKRDNGMSDERRRKLLRRIALNTPSKDVLYSIVEPMAADIADIYPPDDRPSAPTTDEAIDTFIVNYGKPTPREDELLERLIFNPTPDYALLLADEEEHSLPLPEAVNRNLFHPSAAAGLDSLPRTLREAITVAGQSEFISRELPVALMNKYFEYQTQLCHDAEGAPDTESWERAHSFLII